MSAVDLQTPIIEGGISSVNFFNGRLLTARDLSNEQSANREANRRLGQALGEGVAYGLEVSQSPASNKEAPVVTVEAGLALNRSGQALKLAHKTDIALVRQASTSTAVSTIFGECLPLQSGTYVAGAGVYLLTMAPAERRAGRAVTNGLDSAGTSCNTDATVSAVQFRLLQLDPPLTAAELSDQNHLRNLIAYRCFGVSVTRSFVSDPFAQQLKTYGLLDELRDNMLTDCDVPLAVLHWTLADGIKFIDLWSVRRRLTQQSAAGNWAPFVDERRMREGESMFLQFAEQIRDLLIYEAGNLGSIVASARFAYLPPAGFMPVDHLAHRGFDATRFFEGLTIRTPIFIEGARAEQLVRESLAYSPIKLNEREVIWLYFVRENMQAFDQGAINSPQSYLLFTTAHMPYQGDAHFDVSHWNYGNYTSMAVAP